MKVLERATAWLRDGQKRTADQGPDRYFTMFANSRRSAAYGDHGIEGIAAVYACTQRIAESIATIPLELSRVADNEPATDHPLYEVLHRRANAHQTAMEVREQLCLSTLLTGNGFARLEHDSAGQVAAMYPLHPEQVEIEFQPERSRLRYVHRPADGRTAVLLPSEVLHVRYRSVDGVHGRSPIGVAHPTFELAAKQARFAQAFLENSGRPAGALVFPEGAKPLSDEAFTRLTRQLNAQFSGPNTGTPLLEAGLRFEPITLNQRDAQFVEQLQLTALDVCRVFGMPPPLVGYLEHATYSNISEQSQMLLKYCLRPWMVRIEQAMENALLTDSGRKLYRIEHNAEGLLRGSQKERFESYRIAREWGWLSVNEIRELENWRGIGAAGDEYRVPMNSEALGGDDKETLQ